MCSTLSIFQIDPSCKRCKVICMKFEIQDWNSLWSHGTHFNYTYYLQNVESQIRLQSSFCYPEGSDCVVHELFCFVIHAVMFVPCSLYCLFEIWVTLIFLNWFILFCCSKNVPIMNNSYEVWHSSFFVISVSPLHILAEFFSHLQAVHS